MTTEQKFLAIMFVDVRGSTRLYELYGDKRGRELTAWSVKIFDHYVSYYGGTVIKTMGDGAMATLPSAEEAVRTAIAVQEAHAQAPVNVGVGFQIGNVLSEGGDVFGDAVNVAARLCSLAKSGEILTTEEAVKRFPPDLRNATRHIDTTTVKGRREEIKIYQVLWNQDEEQTVTIMAGMAPSRQSRRGSILVLNYRGQSLRLGEDTENFSLGRMGCDLTVPDNLASRQHAKLEFRRGKFMLTDQSTNGTFVLFANNDLTTLRREEMELRETGFIGLGRPPTEDNPHRVAFNVASGD